MKRILIAMLAIVGVLFATSCGSDDDDGVSLTLSEKSIEFTKEAGEKTVNVTTEAETWSAIGSADWIDVVADGANLKVMVKANETVYARKGKVLVVAGNANATVEIMQAGEKGQAEVIPQEVTIADKEGTVAVEVNANDQKWSAVSDAEWLTVKEKPHKGEMLLSYKQNTGLEDRSAVVTITVGNDETIVDVKQLGKMFFLLPYGDLANATQEQVKEFEAARLNTLNEDSSDATNLVYKTRSNEMFPTVRYEFAKKEKAEDPDILKKAVLNPVNAEVMEKNMEGFIEYLEANGFEAESETIFNNKALKAKAEIQMTEFWGMKFYTVIFTPVIDQPGDMPTFKEFPYPYMVWGAKKDKIEAHEAEKEGTYNEDISSVDPNQENDMLVYDRKQDDEGKTKHSLYFVNHDDQDEPGLTESGLLMAKIDLVFYMAGDEAVLTKEFKELCKKEGFEYEKPTNGFFLFKHPEKKIRMVVGHRNYQGIGEVVHLATFKLVEEEGGAVNYELPANFENKFSLKK